MTGRKTIIKMKKNENGSCSIWINNAILYPNIFDKISRIIARFTDGEELYFGHYKKDGVNISCSEFKQYGTEIEVFFRTNGRYYPIEEKFLKKGKWHVRQELTVCSASNEGIIYDMLEKIFHYYLETVLFSPKIEWNTFVNLYKNYMHISVSDYVVNGYTDFVFLYLDSGDFCITFDSKKYDAQIVKEIILEIILSKQ